MLAALARNPDPSLLGVWADTRQVHALLGDGAGALIASVDVEGGCYPALSPARPAAARPERMIRDLWGHVAAGGDERTWLDHGRWPMAHPLSPRPGLPGGAVEPPRFPAVEQSGLTQVPLGPVHGLISEPLHLRLMTRGDTVLRAEARHGYAHKGILALMRGKSPRAAARFIARLAAETTVAHSVAFARASERALDTPAPPRAAALRAAMLEQEQIAGHLDDLARLADAAGLAPLHAVLGEYRERLLRAAERAFGHRLMMDVVVPGGLSADIAPDGVAALRQAADGLAAALPSLRRRL
ncbi:MAG TPA: hydrogenase expression protein HypE, partial [Acetobacteraceae bacterium]|nr:hydrogenase expression protein HypE [Acetobacteraceae bacterium]